MAINSFKVVLLFCTALLYVSLAADLAAQNSPATTDKEQIQARSSYIEGLAAFENENYQKALKLLKKSYVKLPDHPGVNFALADTYYKLEDLANAAYYGKQSIKLDPENRWYYLKLADIYRENDKNSAAADQLKTGLEHHPNNSELLRELAQLYSEMGQLRQANKIYNKLLYLRGDNIKIHLKKLNHFDRLNMRDSVIAELQKIRDLNPDNLSTLQLLSNQYLEMNRLSEAKEVLQEALQIHAGSQTLMMLSDIYMQEAQWDSAGTLLQDVITDSAIAEKEKLKTTRFLYKKFTSDTSNTELRRTTGTVLQQLMEAEPKSSRAQALAADFFAQTGQHNLALQALEKTTSLTPTSDTAWRKRLQLLLMEGKTKKAVSVGQQAAEEIPQNPKILYFLGSAHLSNQDYEKAIEHLTEALKLPVRPTLESRILAELGNAHAALENWGDAFQNYGESLKIDPQNASVLNNYAYYLSVQKTKLQKAETMAQKALKLDPKNPTYLDTMGWVFYQQGTYSKARKFIVAALENGGDTAKMMEHFGDVLHKLNESQKAKRWWKKALEKDSTRTYLKDKISGDGE